MLEKIVSERDFITLFGIRIDRLDLRGFMNRIDEFLNSGQRFQVMYVNIHCMNTAWNDLEYKKIINSADLVYCDGAGVVAGSRILGFNLLQRMTGADWIYNLCELCAKGDYSIYLLGGEPGIAEQARDKLISKFPNLKITGTHHGYFEQDYNRHLIEKINSTLPDILLVGMGTPKQEKWINEFLPKLPSVKIAMGVGGSLDYISGHVSRAPLFFRQIGLEWVYRLACEPKRFGRIFNATVKFLYFYAREKTD